jgi:hypothetical protein
VKVWKVLKALLKEVEVLKVLKALSPPFNHKPTYTLQTIVHRTRLVLRVRRTSSRRLRRKVY